MENEELLKRLDELQSQVNSINNEIAQIKSTLGYSVPQHQPLTYVRTPYTPKPKKERTKKENLESNIGKNVMGLLASLLIFFGIVSLGVLVYAELSQELRFIAVFLISFAFFGTGLFLNFKKPGTLAKSLLSCGIGAVYISIFLTHFYFFYIDEIALFALLLLWSAITFSLNFFLKSELYTIISYSGFGIAIMLGGLSPYGSYPLVFSSLLLLQAVFSGVILFRNLSNGYRTAITGMSLVLSVLLSFAMDVKIEASIITSVIILMGLNYFLLFKIVQMDRLSMRYPIFIVFTTFSNLSLATALDIEPLYLFVFVSLFIFLAFIRQFIGYAKKNVTMLYTAAVIMTYILASENCYSSIVSISGGLIFAVPMFLAYLASKDEVLMHTGLIASFIGMCGAADLFDMKFMNAHMPVYFVFAVLIITFTIISGVFSKDLISKNLHFANSLFVVGAVSWPVSEYLTAIIFKTHDFSGETVLRIVDVGSKAYKFGLYTPAFIVLVLYFTYFMVVRYTSFYNTRLTNIGIRVLGLLMTSLGVVLLYNLNFCELMRFMVLIIAFSLYFISTRELIECKERFMGFYVGIKTTVFLNLVLFSYLHKYNEISYVYSLISIIIAIIFIMLGFKIDKKSFRLYGLALSIINVLKLVLIDISYTSSIGQVVSFIVSGLLCFCIVWIYNIAQNYLGDKEKRGDNS